MFSLCLIQTCRGVAMQLHKFITAAVDGGSFAPSCRRYFTTRENPQIIIKQVGWIPEPVLNAQEKTVALPEIEHRLLRLAECPNLYWLNCHGLDNQTKSVVYVRFFYLLAHVTYLWTDFLYNNQCPIEVVLKGNNRDLFQDTIINFPWRD